MFRKIYYKSINIISDFVNRRYEKRIRNELTNDNFTILCSNCIGGIIYNRLGKQFMSPTINMWFTQGDFIKFVVNLDYYLSLELDFIEMDVDYPVAKLDDITLHFNHSKSVEEAKSSWERRKTRINKDNTYIIFYYREGYTIEQIREIEKANYKKVIVLTDSDINVDYSLKLKRFSNDPNNEFFLNSNLFGIRSFEKQWNYVKWLND